LRRILEEFTLIHPFISNNWLFIFIKIRKNMTLLIISGITLGHPSTPFFQLNPPE
jgi:hypothetical protein